VISQQIRQKTCPIRWAGNCGSPNRLEKNFIKVLVVTSRQRDSRLPNVPTLEEIAPADKKPLLEAMYSVQGRTFAMPPGGPPERVKILRDAFATMFKDRDFQQDVDKLGWNDELIRGDELNKKVDGLVHNEIGDGRFSKNIAITSFRAVEYDEAPPAEFCVFNKLRNIEDASSA
jgi:hypothetical protein